MHVDKNGGGLLSGVCGIPRSATEGLSVEFQNLQRCFSFNETRSMFEEEGYTILLSRPTYRRAEGYIPEERSTTSYAPPSQRFRVQRRKRYNTQYSHLYYNRLESLRRPVQDAARRKWGEHLSSCARSVALQWCDVSVDSPVSMVCLCCAFHL